MESPSAPAEAASVPQSASDKAADFEKFLFDDEPEQEEEAPVEGEGEEPELEIEEEADEQEGEPEAPAIAPPASLNAEEKAAFLSASPEAQKVWAASESRRNAQVQEATTKASEAQRTADARAATADAQARAIYAQQLNQFVQAFEPVPPDPMLARQNPAEYIAQDAQYKAMKAQHDALVQQVNGLGTEAAQEVDQTFIANRDRELMAVPQIANPETREKYLNGIFELADAVGFGREQIVKNATASEVVALGKIMERLTTAEAKAAKFDQAMAKQMQRVRASKGKTLRPNAAPSGKATGDNSWQRVTGARTKEAQAEAFADWMGI